MAMTLFDLICGRNMRIGEVTLCIMFGRAKFYASLKFNFMTDDLLFLKLVIEV